jgi:hypothetical protein
MRSRTSFVRHDLTEPPESNAQYDLAISNPVFHNMRENRFMGHDTVFGALKARDCFVFGDLFPDDKTDVDYFRGRSTRIDEDEGGGGPGSYKMRVSKKTPRTKSQGVRRTQHWVRVPGRKFGHLKNRASAAYSRSQGSTSGIGGSGR